MSQFRTTADVLDEILQEAGEATNGNSPFESLALTAANHVNHAFLSGGTIINLNVDEPWVWSRARFPLTLELQAGIDSGFSTTADSVSCSFTAAQASSLKGWHIQPNGKNTVYKIMNHTAGATAFTLDSGFIDDTGTYGCRIFKLDYEVVPSYFYIDSSNDRVNFKETAATTYTASLTHGTYTAAQLITQLSQQFSAAGTGTVSYGGTFDSVTKFFNLTASVTFQLLGATGADYRRSALPTFGFDYLDKTGAQTYTGTYTPNSISRLIEPFKVHSGSQQFIYSTDPIRLQQDYPLAYIREAIPTRFARIGSDRDGTLTVRFNAFPENKTKVQLDWCPKPLDLQDNTASFVPWPREDMKTFIYAAASIILFNKEDQKWEQMLGMARTGYEAMKLKNHALLHRTGEHFGQIVPREDMHSPRRMRYGYTSDGG